MNYDNYECNSQSLITSIIMHIIMDYAPIFSKPYHSYGNIVQLCKQILKESFNRKI